MRINFYPIRQFQLGAAGPIAAAEAATQGIFGAFQTIMADARLKKLLARRKAYEIPQELFDIRNALANARGYDPGVLEYLTGQVDRGFSSSLNTAQLLGADPNELSALFDQKIQASLEIGAKNQLINMQRFGEFLKAESVIADNRAAKQKSQQDLIKDQMQSAAADKAAGVQNIGSAFNAGIGIASSYGTANLYGQNAAATPQYNSTLDPSYYIDVYRRLIENQNRRVG